MRKNEIINLVATAAVLGFSVWNFMNGDIVWGVILAGAAVYDAARILAKRAKSDEV